MIACQLVVALAAESRPIIDYFRLKQVPGCAYRTYANDTISLVETGIGKLNSAAGTAAALTRLVMDASPSSTRQSTQSAANVCINVGIAGSDRAVGDLVVAHQISDATTTRRWFPQLTWNPPCDTLNVMTVETPATNYRSDTAFDQEASGFVQIANRFTTMEFVHSFKIISDNTQMPLDSAQPRLDKSVVSQLIADRIAEIETSIEQLIDLAKIVPDTAPVDQLLNSITDHFHVSVSQVTTLRHLLQRCAALTGDFPSLENLQKHDSTKDLILSLQTTADSVARVY